MSSIIWYIWRIISEVIMFFLSIQQVVLGKLPSIDLNVIF